MNKKRFFATGKGSLCLALIFIATVILALAFGSAKMDITEFFGGIMKKDGFETESTILYSLRLPRIVAGILAGIGLSASGVLLQAVTGNHLASPGIIGVNSGAGFAVILLLAFFPFATAFMPFAAFFGALTTTLLILSLSSSAGFSKSTVILSGVAVSALLNAAISFISYADTDVLSLYNYFSVGSLSQTFPERLVIPCMVILLSTAIAILLSHRIDTLCLGDSIALSLGINVKALRFVCLVLSSALAGASVSFAGLLGFVGLVVPHIARKLCGNNSKNLIISSSIIGATLVVLADLTGRLILAPTEVPVGIMMAFIGAPFLFYVMIRRKINA